MAQALSPGSAASGTECFLRPARISPVDATRVGVPCALAFDLFPRVYAGRNSNVARRCACIAWRRLQAVPPRRCRQRRLRRPVGYACPAPGLRDPASLNERGDDLPSSGSVGAQPSSPRPGRGRTRRTGSVAAARTTARCHNSIQLRQSCARVLLQNPSRHETALSPHGAACQGEAYARSARTDAHGCRSQLANWGRWRAATLFLDDLIGAVARGGVRRPVHPLALPSGRSPEPRRLTGWGSHAGKR
jgi:hypothetical protein